MEKNHRFFIIDKSVDDAFMDLQKALNTIGTATLTDRANFILEGRTKYGLQSIKVHLTLTSKDANHSIINIRLVNNPSSSEILLADTIDRLKEAIQNADNPNYKPKKNSLSLGQIILGLIIFVLVLLINLYFVKSFILIRIVVFIITVLVAVVFSVFFLRKRNTSNS